MSGGSTSGTPPTFVLTHSKPQLAASNIAMQNASVREVLRKMWPLQSTFLTSEWCKAPRSSTLSAMLCFSRISCKTDIFGPSPPMMKWTLLYFLKIGGITSTSKSTPLRNVSRQMTTMLILFTGYLRPGLGVNFNVSTELGITKILLGSTAALKVRLSLLALLTQMQA